jgi:hypothetical protein
MAAAIAVTCLGSHRDAAAITPGRAWAPKDTFRIAGHAYTQPEMLLLTRTGEPFAVLAGVAGPTGNLYGARWSNEDWTTTWELGYGVNFVLPGVAEPDRYLLVWQTLQPIGPNGFFALVVAEAYEDHIDTPDTVALVQYSPSLRYSGAKHGNRRWVGKADRGDLRLWTSGVPGAWTELNMPGVGSDGVAVGAVDDTTALVVFQWLDGGTQWGHMRGMVWEEGPPLFAPPPTLAAGVSLRRNPDGGFWAGWVNKDENFYVTLYSEGAWSPVDTIPCAYRHPYQNFASSVYVSHDEGTYPAVAWSSFTTGGFETICVCVPTDDGFTVADNLENSELGIRPVVVRDRNGDAWVAWWRFDDGMFFTHTYTVATSSAPTVSSASISSALLGQSPRMVRWTLSEPAPETWWAVLAARDGGPYEEAARVRATKAVDMEWIDTSPPAAEIRYRIRRESVDERYEWLSEEVVWEDPTATELALMSAEAGPDRVVLRWQGSGAGALEATVERRGESTGWQPLGPARPESADRLRYEDRAVVQGERYGYRLSYDDDGAQRYSAEAWLDVPRALALALEGFRPNPASREAVVAFTLPESGSAVLELIDITGRRVFSREVGALGPGRHTVRIDDQAALAPGVYVIRLTQGGRVVQARGVVMK